MVGVKKIGLLSTAGALLVACSAYEGGEESSSVAIDQKSLESSSCTVPAPLSVRQYNELVVKDHPTDPDSYANLSDQHIAARNRQRRIIVNSDGNEAWGHQPVDLNGNGSLVEEAREIFLDKRLRLLNLGSPGNAIDTFVFEVTTGGFGSFTHETAVGYQRDWDLVNDNDCFAAVDGDKVPDNKYRDPELCEGFGIHIPYEISKYRLSSHIDPVQESLDYVHQFGLELLIGFRMNDTHDASPNKEWYENNYSKLKLDDEVSGSFIFAKNPFRPSHLQNSNLVPFSALSLGRWSAVDYGAIAIRNTMEAAVKEVIQSYEVEGVQLNFMRHPVFFRRTAHNGGAASDCERAKMTDMMVRIRNQANKQANSRRRPILISIVIPDSLDYSKDIGLDVRNWYQRGLVDLVVGADYMQLQDWQTSVDETAGHPVKFYAGFTDPRFGPAGDGQTTHLNLRDTNAGFRGRAHEALAENVTGIQLSNGSYTRNSYRALYSALASLITTATAEMLHFGSFMGYGSIQGRPLSYNDYFSLNGPRPLVAPTHILKLASSSTTRWSFRIGRGQLQQTASIYVITEDITAAQRGTSTLNYTDSKFFLRIVHDNFSPVEKIIKPSAYSPQLPVELKQDPNKVHAVHGIVDCNSNGKQCRYAPRMLRFDIPSTIAAVLASPTLKVDVVNSDPNAHLSMEDIFVHTSPHTTLTNVLTLSDFD